MQSSATIAVASMAGQSHLRAGRPNQDSAGVWSSGAVWPRPILVGAAATSTFDEATTDSVRFRYQPSSGTRLLVVSDGHGSSNYDRSDRGAALAVLVTLNILSRAADRMIQEAVPSRWWDYDLPRKIGQQWRVSVLSDAAAIGDRHSETSPNETIRRYGATLVAALLTSSGSLFLQLGDGDLTVVEKSGTTLRPTIATTPQLGTETHSLCLPDAEHHFRVAFHPNESYRDALVVLTSDGISTSFIDDDGYLAFVASVDQLARSDRRGAFHTRLERWLALCSNFSGDDVSAAVALPVTDGIDPCGGSQHE